MKIQRIGKRGMIFTFDDLKDGFGCITNVYVIRGRRHIFICDTYLGPEPMKGIMSYVEANFDKRPIIVFNSHSDWDHIWGNCFFKTNTIIAHRLCRERIVENGHRELCEYRDFHRGKVELVPPNLTFDSQMDFVEDGVKFFYSPGHTEDSASCFDMEDKILYAGDNLERPTPFLQWNGLQTYIVTLKNYLKLNFEAIIPSHSEISGKDIIINNMEYIYSRIHRGI
ncbi:MBL fold metallo-hydrolase [Fonticella tunisiensis]|uniref:Glyoxylase-like metal-dependent hydrolase (Beta-lactamase superfamily II) n=1 Tax=Fonticella tunisiensis TaxID=1096341 RepID=A0A4R7KAE8_9CLOT|nr:MBL fold metallo-hydrolase [Fonticella tunisiensis]TDT51344.1 glyoxylase-like metal-dependent hydrolase (beta-lactamase superfamily II) [Fonticella tunisiensis]